MFDDSTKQKMLEPRCGFADVFISQSSRRHKRYSLSANKWLHTILTYRVSRNNHIYIYIYIFVYTYIFISD